MNRLNFAFALFFSVAASPGFAQTYSYLGKSINVVAPDGQCVLGSSPIEQEIRNQTSKAMMGYNHVVAVFAECGELRQVRAGKLAAFSSYGQLLAATPKGQPTTMQGMSRAEYLARFSKQAGNMDDTVRRMKELMKARNPNIGSTQSLGILKVDGSAGYMAILQDLPNADGSATPGTGVVGFTTVRDLPITINFYRKRQGPQVLQEMVTTQSATLANFVAANP
jgi:hypothetical protein